MYAAIDGKIEGESGCTIGAVPLSLYYRTCAIAAVSSSLYHRSHAIAPVPCDFTKFKQERERKDTRVHVHLTTMSLHEGPRPAAASNSPKFYQRLLLDGLEVIVL